MADRNEIAASAARLRRQLDGVRDHQRSVWLGEGMGLLFAVLVPAIGIVMVADNLAHLHIVLRLLFLAGLVGVAAWLGRRIAALIAQPLTPEMIAVKVERQFPDVDNHLINSLLLAHEDDDEAMELIHAIIAEGNADATRYNLRDAVPKRRMRLFGGGATLAVALMAVYAGLFPSHFTNALARVLVPFLGTPPLTRTRIVDVTPKDHNLLAGDDLTIAAVVDGRIPDTAEVIYEPDGDEMQVAIMRPADAPKADAKAAAPDGSAFRCLMADVAKPFTYSVAAGDARSQKYRVVVHHRPVVSELDVRVAPPAYTGLKPLVQRGGTVKALPGSVVTLRAKCSKPIAKASLTVSTAGDKAMSVADGTTVTSSFKVTANATYSIGLTDTFGFANKPAQHDVELLVDEPPEVKLLAPPPTVVVRQEGVIPFQFAVTDHYGVASVTLVRLTKDDKGKLADQPIETWTAPNRTTKTVTARAMAERGDVLVLPVSRLAIPPGGSAVLQLVAADWNDVTGPGITRSRQVVVTVMKPKDAAQKRREALKRAALELAQIIQKQRRNIGLGRVLLGMETRQAGAIVGEETRLRESITLQEDVRSASGKLVALMDDKVPMRAVVRGLYESEMVRAVTQLKAVPTAKKAATAMDIALGTEREILARLTGRSEQLRRTVDTTAIRDALLMLGELIRKQKKLRGDTHTIVQAGGQAPSKPLADRQDKLAAEAVAFKESLVENARAIAQSDTKLAKRFEEAAKMVGTRGIRQNMILSAVKLAKGALAEGVPVQDKVIADLEAIAKFLREPITAAASKRLKDLKDLVQNGKEKAERMSKLQAAINEISKELERSKDLRGDKAEEMAKKAEELEDLKEKLADATEQLAKDLSLFPEIPACNEMVEEMREVFEDIEQRPGSAEQEIEEIGVDRDEGALAAMEKVKERFADMEMWMMDKPDTIRWKQEGWDVNEMPEIPLVDLPEELEDLVGDLVDQQKDLNKDADDSSSNLTLPDFPAGWDVMDGPMDSFGAKGKSGNERPNSNEMMGRSGSGREGNANGEIVENKAKDLEGTETKVRRTHDPFSKGYVEEENPKSKAKATGGGKQSGVGGDGGLRGAAPARNEMDMRKLQRRQRKLRRNTQSVFSKATLMYLPTGELDQAIVLMHKADKQASVGDWTGFSETQKRIAHALRNTKRVLGGKGAVEMDPLRKLPMDIKTQLFDARDEPIPPEFEKLVSEYYKAIAAGTVK